MAVREPFLKPGQAIKGRWEKNYYDVVKLLGEGGIGRVYLVRDKKGLLKAMKISETSGVLKEYRILLWLNRYNTQIKREIIPRVYEFDDFQIGNNVYNFIITDYCEGSNLGNYKGKFGVRQTVSIGMQIAEFLEFLHKMGCIYADLKPANIIYNFKNDRVYIVDYGSVTQKGEKICQYTPVYDRNHWQAGERIAVEHYDLFSLGMVLAALTIGNISQTKQKDLNEILSLISEKVRHKELRNIIINMLTNKILGCGEVKNLFLRCLSQDPVEPENLIKKYFFVCIQDIKRAVVQEKTRKRRMEKDNLGWKRLTP